MQETKVVTALSHGADATASLLEQLCLAPNAQPPVLVCVFVSSAFELGAVVGVVKALWPEATVMGASSSGEFNEDGEQRHAISAWALWGDFRVQAAVENGLSESPERVIRALDERLNERFPTHPHRVGVMLLDALSGRGEEASLLAATLLGGEEPLRLVGGAAGDDLAMRNTWVGLDGETHEDAVALAFLYSKSPFGIGVEHGHHATTEASAVTRAHGNVVEELDGRPAWEAYADLTRGFAAAGGVDLEALEGNALARFFFTHSASLDSGEEIKVRAPLRRLDNGALSFACGIPEGSVIRMTDSDVLGQLASARAAAEKARAQLQGPCAGALVFDCVCRKLILADEFPSAISAISDALGGTPVAGFETYGEIALDVSDHSGFHNSTTVVLAIPG